MVVGRLREVKGIKAAGLGITRIRGIITAI